MIPLTLAEITAITSGTLHHGPDPSAQVTSPVTCDSRQVTPGGMFAALPGTRADGHEFAAQALAAGAEGDHATRSRQFALRSRANAHGIPCRRCSAAGNG
jgi:UDP-N-acetylmuramoyl-tripeptide--D-alanyl-D-alanine ligase